MVWGFCTAIPGDGGTPAGDEFGGGFEEEEEEEADDDGVDSSDGTQYDQLVDQPPDSSLFKLANDPVSGAGWKPGDPVARLETRDGLTDFERETKTAVIRALQDYDPNGQIWSQHNCGAAFDQAHCAVGWLYITQASRCRRIAGEINNQIGREGSASLDTTLRMGVCQEAEAELGGLLHNVTRIAINNAEKGLPRLRIRHRKV
jgi:hypothetical protein